MTVFLSGEVNIGFGFSKGPPPQHSHFEYQQHMFFTPEERLKGIDSLLFECKYCDCFFSGKVNIGFGCSKGPPP